LLNSAPVIDDVHRTLEAIKSCLDSNGTLDLSRVRGLVEEMAAGVGRNPDAMIWLTRLKKTDQYSYDHAVDVSVHLMVFGRFLGLGNMSIEELGQAGLMQDIGKTQLDPEILAKPSALTDEEYLAVQSHVTSSLELLAGQTDFSPDVLGIVAAHHERHDGSGYPRRLDGDSIDLHSELAGLVDTYCAMTRHRVFSAAVSSQKALEMLSRMRGEKFREALVDQFVQCVGLYPIGTLVELNTGEVAVVIQQNQVRRLKPRLLVLLAQDKTLERRPRTLDLILDPTTPTGGEYRIKQALPSNAYGIDPTEFFLD
jgi:HD-GYP domain-containing protein (c-di-GMP phosphodiesterase class II)